MKTEQELKDQCTPEFIKWMCELAEGFAYNGLMEFVLNEKSYIIQSDAFPILIHRAVEGWNKKQEMGDSIFIMASCVKYFKEYCHNTNYDFTDYQPQSLTQAECAMLDCLIDIFKEEGK